MKKLSEILQSIALQQVFGSTDRWVEGIAFDSRQVKPGYVFVAVKGTQVDGHQYLQKAVESGAIAVVYQEGTGIANSEVVQIQVVDSAQALGMMACNWYEQPSKNLKLVAVTGTNGKTTTATLLHALFRQLGYRAGLLSTVENKIVDDVIPATHTTPDPLALNELLFKMVKAGCSHAFMEASSHAIHQKRIAGLEFAGAVFTNITHDHLDYHGTFENYIKAKKLLFDGLPKSAFSLVNVDDRRGKVMVQNTASKVHTFSLETGASFRGKLLSNTLHGLHMEVDGKEIWFQLVGSFNAYNLLAVYGVARLLGESDEEVRIALSSLLPVRGRFERVTLKNGTTVIIDYAHTPDALQNVLETIQSMREADEQLITVVGCGGNRDKAKRPVMAEVASKLSDHVILTSDNPRNEDPKQIIQEMLDGVAFSARRKVAVIEDREIAIREAINLAKPADIVLVAGKGHESYQEVNGVKLPFDDRQKVLETQNLLKA